MKRLDFGVRAVCLSSLIVLGSSCKTRDANEMGNSGSDEQALVSGSGEVTFFHTLNDTNVCLYRANGAGRNISNDKVLAGLLQESSASSPSARYVNADQLVVNARLIIDGTVAAAINQNATFQTARTIAGQHDALLSNLNKVLDSGIGGGAVFRSVYDRKVAGKEFCRGFLGGVNQECKKNFDVKVKQLEAPLKAYLTFLDTQKKAGRLGGLSQVKTLNEVFNKQVVSNFGIQPAGTPEVFMTPSERQTLAGMRSEGQRLQQQVLSAYQAASKLSDFESQLPVKTRTRTATRSDDAKVTFTTTIKDGGLSKVVEADRIVQAALTQSFKNLQSSFTGTACPDVSDLSKGLEFDVTETVTAAPQPAEPAPAPGGSGRTQVQKIQMRGFNNVESVSLVECASRFDVTENSSEFAFAINAVGGAPGCSKVAIKQFNFVGDGNSGRPVSLPKSALNQGQKCFKVHVLSGGALDELRPNGQFVGDDKVSAAKKMDIVEVCRAQ